MGKEHQQTWDAAWVLEAEMMGVNIRSGPSVLRQ